MLKCLSVLKRGHSFLGCGPLLELLEHMSLKNTIMKLLRCQVDRFPQFRRGVAHASC